MRQRCSWLPSVGRVRMQLVKWWMATLVLLLLVLAMLVASLSIHQAPQKCFTDSNMTKDPTLPCYVPDA